METLPQILEQDADVDISALYEEIKQDTDSSVVNYIWRHLASIDGAAQWAWEFVKLNDNRELSNDIKILAEASARRIIKAEGVYHEIHLNNSSKDILESYNNNNIENLVRVLMLLEVLQDADAKFFRGEPEKKRVRENGVKNTHIPNIPRYDSLDVKEKKIVDELSVAGPSAENGIIPTLWIHLSTQQGLLEEIKNPLTGVLSSTALQKEYDLLRELVVKSIKDRDIRIPMASPKFDVHKARDGLSRFSQTIAELSLIGRVIYELSNNSTRS